MQRPEKRAAPTILAGELPTDRGTYALWLTCTEERPLKIGRLGTLYTGVGIYVYIGSAFGPGGLRARIRHHLQPAKHLHWHLDYLKQVAKPSEIWFSDDPAPREHLWVGLMARSRGATLPMPGFGATDCACPSHLFFFSRSPSFYGFKRRLRVAVPGHRYIYRRPVRPFAPHPPSGRII